MRRCPKCGRELAALAIRCQCGAELPEARDVRSDPDRPACGVCGQPMELMALRCPSCGAEGPGAAAAARQEEPGLGVT